MVKLCRDTGLHILLPAAMCASCFTKGDVTDIVNGVSDPHRVELEPSDKIICLKARERLQSAFRQRVLNALLKKSSNCTSPEDCENSRAQSFHKFINSEIMRDPLQHIFLIEFRAISQFYAGACTACLAMSEATFNNDRADLWLILPSFFQLPSWSDLHNSLQSHKLQDLACEFPTCSLHSSILLFPAQPTRSLWRY
jgi:hypothetical protein